MSEFREKDIKRDIQILKLFFKVYCENRHKESPKNIVRIRGIVARYLQEEIKLCVECERQFLYAVTKRIICPFDPKPECKRCPSICYSDEHRIFMREMMRYSGKYLILHGRLDLILRYLLEVPCCFGIVHIARESAKRSGKTIDIKNVTISIDGNIRSL
ncbi:MAG: nitrous oxide-stimulated promoter family protein [Myxococcota bacterium]